jgi:membrane complex biogenesis BtpA family protein
MTAAQNPATKPAQRLQFVGVVHAGALPGSPRHVVHDAASQRAAPLERLIAAAVADADDLVRGGVDALIVENFGDAPFWKESVPSETIAALALVVDAVQRTVKGRVPVGVNVLRNDVRAALGIAAATGASFVRVNVHTGSAATDQGLIEGRAAETLRERARLCPHVAIWADVHVKHATPLGRETIAEAAQDAAHRGLADALIVTGAATGSAPDARRVEDVRAAVQGAAIYVGSGVTEANAALLLAHADGAIVGTALKHGGRVSAPVDPERVQRMRRALDAVRAPR